MHLAGESEIAASRARVWAAVSNPERTAASTAQGSAQVERIDDRHLRFFRLQGGDDLFLRQFTPFFRTFNHKKRHPVLDGAAGIETLQFGKYLDFWIWIQP